MDRLILGCGPGRCGSRSLSILLDSQADSSCTHSCPLTGKYKASLMELMNRTSRFAADVAPWWLWRASGIHGDMPDAKFIILWRPADEVIRSMESSGYLAATTFGSLRADPEEWVARYYLSACRLAANLPDLVRFCKTDSLSDTAAQEGLLRWCGFDNPITTQELHLNKGACPQ